LLIDMPGLQSLFIILVILVLLYLVIDGLITRSIWIKGGRRSGIVNWREWAHRCERADKPATYWAAMIFYCLALLLIGWLLLARAPG
jgi:hypothetical protein